MTCRERLQAVTAGYDLDRKPILGRPGVTCDAVVLDRSEDVAAARTQGDWAILVEVNSVFARCPNILQILEENPRQGDLLLRKAASEVAEHIGAVLAANADGIFYRLFGANVQTMSPMQYGGHFLEVDREMLYSAQNALFNLVFVEGGAGVYLDCVSDLPADAFGWDDERTGVTVGDVRSMRIGPLATPGPEGDIRLVELVKSTPSQEAHRVGSSL